MQGGARSGGEGPGQAEAEAEADPLMAGEPRGVLLPNVAEGENEGLDQRGMGRQLHAGGWAGWGQRAAHCAHHWVCVV